MKAGTLPKILKWVGYGTAILSLIAGLGKIAKVISDRVEARRNIRALLSSEEVQRQGGDYGSAWRSLEQASQINPNSAEVRDARENLAMEWLENIQVLGDEKFSDITQKLEPVLTRGVVSSKSAPRKADLQAHVGWTYFLISREGRGGLDPAEAYARAVQMDRNNPYAEAMWGHWALWNGCNLSDAGRHFSSALASGRQRGFVRRMQLSALLDCSDDESDNEIVRVLNAMRKEQGSVDQYTRDHVFFIYYTKIVPPRPETTPFINAVPPGEHVATFRWLFDGADLNESKTLERSCYLAVLQEAAAQRDQALANYRLVRSKITNPNVYPSLWQAAATGIQRLSRHQ